MPYLFFFCYIDLYGLDGLSSILLKTIFFSYDVIYTFGEIWDASNIADNANTNLSSRLLILCDVSSFLTFCNSRFSL